MEPRLEFATSADGARIGWMSSGSGPALVHLPGIPFSNAEAEWRIPVLRQAFTSLGERVRLIQYDGRGTGRSDRDVSDLSLAAYLGDLDAVVAAAEIDRCILLGYYASAAHAIAWAARHPERVRGLILFGAAPSHGDTMQAAATQALIGLIERDWDTFVESVTHAWLGWPIGDEGRLAADAFRGSTSPAVARASLEAAGALDVTANAAGVACPVLILHRADARVIPIGASEALAGTMPDARLEILPGSSAGLFFEAGNLVADRIAEFVAHPSGSVAGRDAKGGVVVRPMGGSPRLSPREIEVLRLLAGGETNGQIAARLSLSINTVERHVVNVYRKIDARGRAEATAWALRNGVG
ncbi:MAG TPA: alpha/beta fold hydrolase [Candidatus Limnocylindrales bacterium]|nr:alpha/beta fold hydrolase [Candidatus Limnocylindrales bacterium]